MSPSFTDLENSRSLLWNTRGWTFQEKVFAKRLLLFTDYQVYFRCSESVWTEEIVMETEDPSKSLEARPGKYRWAPDRQLHLPSKKLILVKSFLPKFNVNDEWSYLGNFPDYAAAIREYSQRELTDSGDKLIAINGILRSLRADAGQFVYGLPETHLLQSLLWHCEQGSSCVRENEILPSWTWAAWSFENGVIYDVLDIRVIRMVLLMMRNVYTSCKKTAKKLKDNLTKPGVGEPGSSSTNTSTDSSSTPIDTGCSSSKPSAPGIPPPLLPPMGKPPRDWTTLNAMSKATMNVGACFGWPLVFRHHTMKQVYLYDKGHSQSLSCEDPLTMTSFTKDEHTDPNQVKKDFEKMEKSDAKLARFHRKMAPRYQRPVLTMSSVIVRFRIGVCLDRDHGSQKRDDEIGCYELLDQDGLCVGEIWTTHKQAVHGREHTSTFLTVSWGLSLTRAKIAKKYVPKWDFDATVLPKSRTKLLMKACILFEEAMNWTSAKHLSASYGLHKSRSMDQQPSLTSFFDALLNAHKDEPRPKFLWSTVNVLQVQHVGDDKYNEKESIPVYKRIGVGRVIFNSWLMASSPSKEVILA